MAEHSTADREVGGSYPPGPFYLGLFLNFYFFYFFISKVDEGYNHYVVVGRG